MARVEVRTYLSPTLVLLAFDWGAGRARNDFPGFAIERRPGFWGAASSWLPNRIGFDGPAMDGDLPSNTSPIQKFMWWDARIDDEDRGRRSTHTGRREPRQRDRAHPGGRVLPADQGRHHARQAPPHAGWSEPVQVGGATVRAFFPPEPSRRRASIDAVVQAVDRARSSVVLSLFKPTDRALFDALERHGQAGKLLFGLVNKLDRPAEAADEPSAGAERARVDILHRSVLARETVDHGLFPRGGEPAGFWWERAALPGMASRFPVYIHHKFVVVDAETAHPVIYTGSANMSNNAVHRNDENLLEIAGSPRLAAVYLAEFLRLHEHYRARRHIDRPGRRRPNLALAKDASWARNAFRPGTSQFLSRVRLAAAPP